MDRISSTRLVSRSMAWSIFSRNSCSSSRDSCRSLKRWAMPLTMVTGVRSSCDTLARNSALVWVISCTFMVASARAAASSRSR